MWISKNTSPARDEGLRYGEEKSPDGSTTNWPVQVTAELAPTRTFPKGKGGTERLPTVSNHTKEDLTVTYKSLGPKSNRRACIKK